MSHEAQKAGFLGFLLGRVRQRLADEAHRTVGKGSFCTTECGRQAGNRTKEKKSEEREETAEKRLRRKQKGRHWHHTVLHDGALPALRSVRLRANTRALARLQLYTQRRKKREGKEKEGEGCKKRGKDNEREGQGGRKRRNADSVTWLAGLDVG